MLFSHHLVSWLWKHWSYQENIWGEKLGKPRDAGVTAVPSGITGLDISIFPRWHGFKQKTFASLSQHLQDNHLLAFYSITTTKHRWHFFFFLLLYIYIFIFNSPISLTHLWLCIKLGNLEASCHWLEVSALLGSGYGNLTPHYLKRKKLKRIKMSLFHRQTNLVYYTLTLPTSFWDSPIDTKTANYWKFPEAGTHTCFVMEKAV